MRPAIEDPFVVVQEEAAEEIRSLREKLQRWSDLSKSKTSADTKQADRIKAEVLKSLSELQVAASALLHFHASGPRRRRCCDASPLFPAPSPPTQIDLNDMETTISIAAKDPSKFSLGVDEIHVRSREPASMSIDRRCAHVGACGA